MGTSIGQAIDYLTTGTNPNTGTTLDAALKAVDSTAITVDALPAEVSQSMVVIGKDQPDSIVSQSGSQQLLVLGAGRSTEEYDIPCFVLVERDGPKIKPARDAAIALFDVVAHFIAADRTLGGVLLQGRVADIQSVTLNQDVSENSGAKRIAWIPFTIHCKNHYIP